MMHKFPLPTDAEIENLITQVFESMPDAGQSRLSLIENRLLQKARRKKSQNNLNKIPWWIVLLLAGGFATAAWWAGELLISEQNTILKDKPSVSRDKIIQTEPDKERSESNMQNIIQDNELHHENDSPIIYQREPY